VTRLRTMRISISVSVSRAEARNYPPVRSLGWKKGEPGSLVGTDFVDPAVGGCSIQTVPKE